MDYLQYDGFSDHISDYICYESSGSRISYAPHNYSQKLTAMYVYGNGSILESVGFSYTENNSERLKLKTIAIKGNNDITEQEYGFTYDSRKLPAYNSTVTDNWGYWNNKDYRETDIEDDFFGYRSASLEHTMAETLTGITWPTGGHTLFEYELNDYSRIATQAPDFDLIETAGTAGGLRIKKITHTSDTTSYTHCFEYKNEDGTSSGILSGIPVYEAEGGDQDGGTGSPQPMYSAFYYDDKGRTLTVTHRLDNGETVTVSDLSYDILGRIASDKRNGNPELATAFSYNIRSWLKAAEGDILSMKFFHEDTREGTHSNSPRFDGGISALDWTVSGGHSGGYNFSYDGLSRLTKAEYISEDADGENFSTAYSYDANANLTSDLSAGIAAVSYNSLNLPRSFSLVTEDGTAETRYLYDADGRKLRVTATGSDGGTSVTDYTANVVRTNGKVDRILFEGGYIRNGKYHFFFSDHLGSIRAVAREDGSVIQSNAYYPFGKTFGDSADAGSPSQPYKFNGKEDQSFASVPLLDYGARFLSTRTGRWTSMDPLAERYYSISPYAYCGNNPVNFIDPDGMKITICYDKKNSLIFEDPAVLFKKNPDGRISGTYIFDMYGNDATGDTCITQKLYPLDTEWDGINESILEKISESDSCILYKIRQDCLPDRFLVRFHALRTEISGDPNEVDDKTYLSGMYSMSVRMSDYGHDETDLSGKAHVKSPDS